MQVSFIQKSIVVAFGAVALLGSTAGVGQAFNFNETGDAGPIPGTPQTITDSLTSGLNTIKGTVGSRVLPTPIIDLIDGFQFTATNGSLTVSSAASNVVLSLFDTTGNLLSPFTLAVGNSFTYNFSGLTPSGANYFVGAAASTRRAYTINMAFTPVPPTAVPTPALLPGLAALGFSAIRKRKAKAAVA
jgi:hypothetical protein